MSDEVIIRVEGLGKKYRLGQKSNERYTALRDVIANSVSAPFRRLRNGRRSKIEDGSSKTEDRSLKLEDGTGLTSDIGPLTSARATRDIRSPNSQLPSTTTSSASDFWALKDVSFEVRRGEVVGIIGRNGAGKSTLLKILSRITEPTEGRVRIRGRVASLLEVGTGFHPELTGRENIYLNGAILGMTRAEIQKKFDEIVAFAEIEKFLETPVKRYSSGMYVRLAFAVAAHLEPEILVVDEVLAVGDAEFQKKCLGKMGEVAKGGRTVLFVSHQMNAVEQLCSNAILLDRGEIKAASDDPRSVIHDYLFGCGRTSRATGNWTNIGSEFRNPWFHPLSMRLATSTGAQIAGPVPNSTEVWLEIDAVVETLDPSLTVGCAIFDENGHVLLWSYQTDTAPNHWPRLNVGTLTLRGRLPPRWLNEGSYRIELIGGLHYRLWLFEPGVNAPAVHLTVQGGLSDSPLWTNKRPGILAPILDWHVVLQKRGDGMNASSAELSSEQ
jgi:lipopolysaccharide transport system ATP-binding protein